MALAESFSRMNVEANKLLHPFFSKQRDPQPAKARFDPPATRSDDSDEQIRTHVHGLTGEDVILEARRGAPGPPVAAETFANGSRDSEKHGEESTSQARVQTKLAGKSTVAVVVPRRPSPPSAGDHADEGSSAAVPGESRSAEPRKLLRLNADGTFGPPKRSVASLDDQSSKSQTTAKRKPRPSTIGGRPTSRIVILRYKQNAIRESIQNILATAKKERQNSHSTTDSRIVKTHYTSPKNPHPFFSKDRTKPSEPKPEQTNALDVSNPFQTAPPAANPSCSSDIKIVPTLRSSRPLTKNKASKDAPWPWKGVTHVRDLDQISSPDASWANKLSTRKKAKDTIAQVIESESILCVHSLHNSLHVIEARRPSKTTSTWPDIQAKQQVAWQTLTSPHTSKETSSRGISQPHAAVRDVIARTRKHMSRWDRNRCELIPWAQKYAPICAAHVLQDGKEAFILRDWLSSLQVNNVDSGKVAKSTKDESSASKVSKRKRKHHRCEMDDFIVDENEETLADWTDVEDTTATRPSSHRSRIRQKLAAPPRSMNSVLISGPVGCGKTAAIYAVAKELEFEVFEINAGSRRSAKDIIDKIGNMMENHLVQQVVNAVKEKEKATAGGAGASSDTQTRVEERQGNMKSFFTSSAKARDSNGHKGTTANDDTVAAAEGRTSQQRQSLILFEEVDILFAEDKNFWQTVIALTEHSKRPVVFTCHDETLVPSQALPLHAVLRFVRPNEDAACSYLAAIAAKEGHFIQPASIQSLYLTNKCDLRASINHLDFWCQMAVGSDKGGLDWMMDRYPRGNDIADNGHPLRVMSVDTYQAGDGLVNLDLDDGISTGLFRHSARGGSLAQRLNDLELAIPDVLEAVGLTCSDTTSDVSLETWDTVCDSLSALDVACRRSMRTGLRSSLDAEHPALNAKRLQDNVLQNSMAQTEPITDHFYLDGQIAATVITSIRALTAKHAAHASRNDIEQDPEANILSIIHKKAALSTPNITTQLTRTHFSTALDILANDDTTDLAILSSLDRTLAITTLDLAPYARELARHDLAVDRDNAALLASSQKRARLSRVSRSAADGGRREEKRQQRHFERAVNLRAIVRTGGEGWWRGEVDEVLGVLPGGVCRLPFEGRGLYDLGRLGARHLDDMVRDW